MSKKNLVRIVIGLLVVLVLLAALLVVMIVGSGREPDLPAESTPATEAPQDTKPEEPLAEPTEPATESTEPEIIEPEETEPEETIPEAIVIGEESKEDTEIQDVEIETTYATLYYPGKWKDSLRTEETELEFGADVKFYGTINGQEHWLFTVHFGGAEGIGIGAIMTAEGFMIDVTISMSDIIPGEDWSDEAAEQFNAMQEAMNYVMNKLSNTPGFEG